MSNQINNLVTALAAATNHDDEALAPPAASPAKRRSGKSSKKGGVISKEKRLEQNRKAAIESRRRKKVMVDELKRSVQYYTKANATLKSHNAELERQLLLAKQTILFNQDKAESKATGTATAAPMRINPTMDVSTFATPSMFRSKSRQDIENEAIQAQFAATQALYASMGYPSAAARAAASTFSSISTPSAPVAPPEPKEPSKPTPPADASAAAVSNTLQSNPYLDLLRKSCFFTPNDSSVMMKSMGDVLKQQNSLEAGFPDFTSTSSMMGMDMERIEELNRFAMQQAAAANAAAAAATAAIKAANLHRQMLKGSSTPVMPKFSFPFGNGSRDLSSIGPRAF